jgi:hypothetical protein
LHLGRAGKGESRISLILNVGYKRNPRGGIGSRVLVLSLETKAGREDRDVKGWKMLLVGGVGAF